MTVDRETLEAEVRRLCDAGSAAAGSIAAIRGYGPEILGFLVAQHRNENDAGEVFSIWTERVFRGLPAFAWSASLRTWAYTIARNASMNYVRDRKARGGDRMAGSVELDEVRQEVRTQTPAYMRTEAKRKLAAIRDALPAEDRMLLVLRVDKRLEWKDLAVVMLGDAADVDAAALTRESQRLRKRFQLLKDKLLVAGKRAGILPADE